MSKSIEIACRQALDKNTVTTGDGYVYTAPDKSFYAHQWLWDSALAIEAWAATDPYRAADEFMSLVERGQWSDGMIPNMVINDSRREAFLWNSQKSSAAPRAHATSGISQPPLLAEAAWETAKNLPSDERQAFLHHAVGRLAHYHEWWYHTRDSRDDGLVSVVHPYETGMDNNPALAEHMRTLDWRVPALALRGLNRATAILRDDLKRFSAAERAEQDSTTYASLATLQLRHTHYDTKRISELPFQVQDVHTNSVLIRNNDILAEMAAESGQQLSDFLSHKSAQARRSLEQLWDADARLYFSRDTVSGRLLRTPSIASLMPLYAGELQPERETALTDHVTDQHSFGAPYGVPGQPGDVPNRRNPGYWDGRTMWPFTTHLLTDGLIRSGHDDRASQRDAQFLSAVRQHGPREYFSTENGYGYGTGIFSPTASLALIMMRRRLHQDQLSAQP